MKKEKISKLNEWGKGKDFYLVKMAQQFARSTETYFKLLKSVKCGEQLEVPLYVPNVKEWLKLYQNQTNIIESVIETVKRLGGIAGEVAGVLEKTSLNSLKEGKLRLNEARKELNRIKDQHEADIEPDGGREVDVNSAMKMLEALKNPEIVFFLRVTIPCWLLYGDYPGRMFKDAQHGNLKALKKLLRLDPSVISEPNIAEFLHQTRVKGKKGTYESLIEDLKRGPKEK